jgi:hypothetical protein
MNGARFQTCWRLRLLPRHPDEDCDMLSRLDWIPPPRPTVPKSAGEGWLISLTLVAGVCLAAAGIVAAYL